MATAWTGSALKYLVEKFLRPREVKIKEGLLWVLRSTSLSEMIFSTTYFRVTRKKSLGRVSSGIS